MGSMRNWLRARGNDNGWPPWNAATLTKFVRRNWRDNNNNRDVGDFILSIEWYTYKRARYTHFPNNIVKFTFLEKDKERKLSIHLLSFSRNAHASSSSRHTARRKTQRRRWRNERDEKNFITNPQSCGRQRDL